MDSGIILAEHIETGRMVRLIAVGEWCDATVTDEPCCVCGDWILSGWMAEGEGPSWCDLCVVDDFKAPKE